MTQAIVTYQQCPVCTSPQLSHVLTPCDHTLSQENFEVWQCDACQFRFTQHVPVEAEIGRYYQSDAYISHSNTSRGLINQLYQIVRNFTLRQKRNLIQRVSGHSQGQLLDIGCGTGEFLHTMKKAGWETQGLEPDEGARRQAVEQYELQVAEPEQLFSLSPGTYDVITMWHVLEHVHRLDAYLQKITSLLKDTGTLFIAVPNYQSLDAEHYGENWAAYDVPRHLYHFAPESLRQLLAKHGFAIRDYRRMPFDAFYVSMLSEKYRHGRLRLFSAFWVGFRSFLAAWKNAKRGSSILYVVQKQA